MQMVIRPLRWIATACVVMVGAPIALLMLILYLGAAVVLGLLLSVQAGYDPRAMLDVMKVLMESSKGGRQPEFLVTHPYPENRIKDIDAQLRRDYANGFPADLTRGKALPR